VADGGGQDHIMILGSRTNLQFRVMEIVAAGIIPEYFSKWQREKRK
jgi:hypothetical protein